jgi:imidazolonepropionase-like amidohydrolase
MGDDAPRMRRRVVAGGVAFAVVLGAGLVGLLRTHPDPKCLHVSGAHATAFRAVRVFDGQDMLGPRDVLIVDGSVAAVGGFSCVAAGGAELEEVDAAGDALLPGLIDSLDRASELDAAEREQARAEARTFGVTTMVDALAPAGESGGGAPATDVVRSPRTVADVSTSADAQAAVAAGAAGLAHLSVDTPPVQALVDAIAEKGAFVIPTLGHMQMRCDIPVGKPLLDDPLVGPLLTEHARELLSVGRGGRLGPRRLGCYANALEAMRMLHGRTALLAGSDAPGPGATHGASLHKELELLVLAGLTPVEALRAATSAPASAFDLADRGRLAPGARADLVLVQGDPSADIAATRAIVRVYQSGVRVR